MFGARPKTVVVTNKGGTTRTITAKGGQPRRVGSK
jgi:hypothetical protein